MTPDFTICWKGLTAHTTEECRIWKRYAGFDIAAQVQLDRHTFQYRLTTDANWVTCKFSFSYSDYPPEEPTIYRRRQDGNWERNDEIANELNGCIDIDIVLTPFTNSLPINRLKLPIGECAEIKVAYLNPDARRLQPALQRYTSLNESCYRFETVPNDFEAIITVDEFGFVVHYPGLFERI